MTKYDLEKYMEEIFSEIVFLNDEIGMTFFNFLLTNIDNPKYAGVINIRSLNSYKQVIISYYKDIQSLTEINVTWLTNNLCEINDSNKTNRLVHLLYSLIDDHEVIKNNFINLYHTKSFFTKQIKKNYILEVLQETTIVEYKNHGFLESPKGLNLLFLKAEEADYLDPNMHSLFSDYIEYTKFTKNLTIESLINFIRSIIQIGKLYFSKVHISNVNYQFILSTLPKLKERKFLSSEFFEIIFFGIDNSYIIDNDILRIRHLKQLFISKRSYKSIIDMLKHEEPWKYILIKNKNEVTTAYFLSINVEFIKNLLIEFIANGETGFYSEKKSFTATFAQSLNNQIPITIDGFDGYTFLTQVEYYKSFSQRHLSVLINFYLFIYQQHNPLLFTDSNCFDINVLQRSLLASELMKGFVFVSYNSFEEYPAFDKWIFFYGNNGGSNLAVNKNFSQLIDFSTIKNPFYREWIKYYIWYQDISVYSKMKIVRDFKLFCNYITDIKSGKQLTFFETQKDTSTISATELMAYKNFVLSNFSNTTTRSKKIYNIRGVLGFLVENELIKIDPTFKYHLTYSAYSTGNDAQSISEVELNEIAIAMKKDSRDNIIKSLYYIIFYLLLETNFRISQILALERDCVSTTYKTNQYVINSKTKSSPKDPLSQPITTYVKRQLDEVLKLTEKYHNACNRDNIKNYLFLVPSERIGMYSLISRNRFNRYLKICCQNLGFDNYTTKNLRDTHMTKAIEYRLRNSLSDLEERVLTGHVSKSTTSRHYEDTDLTTLLESVHGIIIGNVSLTGTILKEKPYNLNKRDIVSNQCGYCSTDNCNNFTFLDCLVCKSFITCIDRIPYFYEQIKVINTKIKASTIKHDIEDLITIKTLLAAYLRELLVVKENS